MLAFTPAPVKITSKRQHEGAPARAIGLQRRSFTVDVASYSVTGDFQLARYAAKTLAARLHLLNLFEQLLPPRRDWLLVICKGNGFS